MIDLHTHTFFSDGVLVPAELVRRAHVMGYRCIAITDHADSSNAEAVVSAACRAADALRQHWAIRVLPGVELTHNPPQLLPALIAEVRKMGAKVVVVHGETIVEPVPEGTNRMALEGGADILAHPGLIGPREASLAAKRGVRLEITTRRGHSITNGHVVRAALKAGAEMVIDTDAHAPSDLVSREEAERVGLGAGLDRKQVKKIFREAGKFVQRLDSRRA